MSSNKSQKWSSSSSLSKLLSRITRTLSFSSKKSQQTLKNNTKQVKKGNVVPQSAPLIRRHPPQPISKFLYIENYRRPIVHQNMYVESDIEEDDDDTYSLRPNLSLFNISTENVNYRQQNWLDDVLHSTKIEDY